MIGRFIAATQELLLARNGRPAAIAVLLALFAANTVSEVSFDAGFKASLGGKTLAAIVSPFSSGRQLLFDSYQRLWPRVRQSQPVTIVEIDESSLKRVGQWPWPRNRLADLVDAIARQQPAAIGLDMYMPEADQTSPDRVAAGLAVEHKDLAMALRRLPSHEQRLATALHQAPTVLGAAGFDFSTLTTTAGLRTTPMRVTGGDALPFVRRYAQVLASLPQLQAAAHGQAVVSVSSDDTVVHRLPLLVAVGEQLVPSLALEMLRVATGEPAISVEVDTHGVAALQVADLRVPSQSGGDIWLHFARRVDAAPREVSAADVMDGKVSADALTGKLVLVGLTGAGLSDQRATPLAELVPGVEIQAQVLETLFDGRFLLRPWWMKPLELALLAGLGLVMVWQIPHTGSRVARVMTSAPRASSWAVMALNGSFVVIGFALFMTRGLLFDAASLFIGFSAVLASLVSSAMIKVERENEQLAQEQQRLREEHARVAGELAAARQIQLASLPQAAQVLAGEGRFAVAAMLEPAREVGGDLYDFFMLDARHLFFAIGDVSGKGVPASLFMAVAKALTKSAARRNPAAELAHIVEIANREIGGENPESLFVTLVAGIFDAESGHLLLCNAGHDAPLCRRDGGVLEPLAAASGPPLCALEAYAYAVEAFTLQRGDTLLLFTDGVTDAADAAGEAYGSRRLRAVVAAPAGAGGPDQLLAAVREDVRHFVGGADPADDLTLLAIQRN